MQIDQPDPAELLSWEIEPLHDHCQVEASTEFENILAGAAGHHLGAYVRQGRDTTEVERRAIKDRFACIGEYEAFELLPGIVADCSVCGEFDHHVFCSWFYGLLRDWCFLVVWPQGNLLWIGSLTDTD